MLVHTDDDDILPVKQQENPYTAINWTMVRCDKQHPIQTGQLLALEAVDLFVSICHYDATTLPMDSHMRRRRSLCVHCGNQFSYEMATESTMKLSTRSVQRLDLV